MQIVDKNNLKTRFLLKGELLIVKAVAVETAKLTAVETAKLTTAYYNLQWVNSPERNWFVGAGPVDHNNGIEGTNDDIKKTKVIRDKQNLQHLQAMLLILLRVGVEKMTVV